MSLNESQHSLVAQQIQFGATGSVSGRACAAHRPGKNLVIQIWMLLCVELWGKNSVIQIWMLLCVDLWLHLSEPGNAN